MLLELIIIMSIISVISAKNPVHSTLFLVIVFLNTAMLLISKGIDFIGIFIIIVYVGAIAILFLFVVMMLNIKLTEWDSEPPFKYLPIGFFFGVLFFFLFYILSDSLHFTFSSPFISWINELNIQHQNQGSNLTNLGVFLYTFYLPYLMMAAIILLVAMVGVIVLTFTQITSKHNHYQTVFQQNSAFLNNHLFV